MNSTIHRPLRDGDHLDPLTRRLVLTRAPAPAADGAAASVPGLDTAARTLELTFSSEEPVERWFGQEVLSHAADAANLERLNDGAPLLFNHNMDDVIGVVEGAQVGADARGHAVVRFARTARGDEVMGMVADGVLRNVSFMYRVDKYQIESDESDPYMDDDAVYTATQWTAYEISIVTVPADATVGVGRAVAAEQSPVQITVARQGGTPASSTHTTPAPQAHIQEPSMHTRMLAPHRLQEQADPETRTAGGAVAPGAAPAAGTDPAAAEAQRAAHARGAEAERQRIAEISAMCRAHKIGDELLRGLIEKGASIADAKLAVADAVIQRAGRNAPAVDLGASHNPDLSEREKARYSMIRAINAAVSGDWSKAGFELECSNEVARRSGRGPQNEKAFFVPTNIGWATRATLTVGTPGSGTTGGTLVATQLLAGSFIEALRNQARVFQLGATVLSGLIGSVDIPRQTGQASAYWVTEGTNVTQSEPSFDKVSLAMKNVGTFSQVTRNMLMQSTPDVDMILRADLIRVLALGIDLAALSGSGASGVPLGITNQSGVGSVVGGANGAAVTIDHLIDLETQVAAANAPEDSLAYLANAKTIGALKKLRSTTGQYLWTTAPGGGRSATPGEINGYAVARSNQARSTLTKGSSNGVCSEIFFGSWSELVIGEWGVLEIVPNPYDAAVYKNGGVLLRALQSVDVAVRHAASFSVMSDALTA